MRISHLSMIAALAITVLFSGAGQAQASKLEECQKPAWCQKLGTEHPLWFTVYREGDLRVVIEVEFQSTATVLRVRSSCREENIFEPQEVYTYLPNRDEPVASVDCRGKPQRNVDGLPITFWLELVGFSSLSELAESFPHGN